MSDYCRVCGKKDTPLKVCSIECGSTAADTGMEHQARIQELKQQLAAAKSALETIRTGDIDYPEQLAAKTLKALEEE